MMMDADLEPIPVTSQKHDPAWKHCLMFKNGERVQLKCIYCGKIFKGGGIHRIKEHLAGQKGNASTCIRTPSEVRISMQQSLEGVMAKKKRKQKIAEEITSISVPYNEADTFQNQCDTNTGVLPPPNTVNPSSSFLVNQEEWVQKKSGERRKRGRQKILSTSGDVLVNNSVGLGSKRVENQIHMAIGRFFYDVGLPLHAVSSEYFLEMVNAIASQGSGIVLPSYHDLRGWILKNSLEEVLTFVDRCTVTRGRTGCSLMIDQWNTEKGRIMTSFLVYCPEGTIFLRSVDISDMLHSVDALCELVKEVVEEIGVEHVLQVITNGEEPYTEAGKRWIREILERAKSITRFIYNRSIVLNMMRRYTFGNDLVVQGMTIFSSNFTTLKRMVDLKHNLQSMVTSQEWMDCPYSKKPGGLVILDLISSREFWSSCTQIVRLTNPLLRLLEISSSKRRPAMGYVYAGMYRAKEAIKRELVGKEEYMVYWNIMDHWWEEQWQLPLHAAGFYLNPKFFYSVNGEIRKKIMSKMFDCIERLVPDSKVQDKLSKELTLYMNAAGDFGRKMAIRARDTLLPDEWWSTYGAGCPNLAHLAIRILSQASSLFGCKRNHICFEEMHNTRNFLEHRRLTDLAFVQCNLGLRKMSWKNKIQDSLDLDSFDGINDWVTDKEPCLEDCGSSDWISVDPPSGNTSNLGPSVDDFEELGGGFEDLEIFGIQMDDERTGSGVG